MTDLFDRFVDALVLEEYARRTLPTPLSGQ
jgi:hypothetical protein